MEAAGAYFVLFLVVLGVIVAGFSLPAGPTRQELFAYMDAVNQRVNGSEAFSHDVYESMMGRTDGLKMLINQEQSDRVAGDARHLDLREMGLCTMVVDNSSFSLVYHCVEK